MRTRITPFKQLPHVLVLACAMTSSLSWAIEIEQRPLSTAPATASPAPAAPAAPASAPQPAAAPVRAQAAKAVPASLSAAPQAINPAWDMFQQIEELRANVARLQGSLEEQQQLITRLQSDLRTRYTDLDQRMEQLAKPIEPAVTAQATAAVTAEPALAAVVTTNTELATSNTVIPNRPRTETSAEEIERQKTSYLAAYQTFRRDGATPAITAMNGFLERYPDSVFAPNAYYWLGEFQLALEPADFAKAEANFQRVLRDYSASPKVASAYYKLGSIADLQGNRKVARDWMSKLITQFPSSPEARLGQSFLDQNPAK